MRRISFNILLGPWVNGAPTQSCFKLKYDSNTGVEIRLMYENVSLKTPSLSNDLY